MGDARVYRYSLCNVNGVNAVNAVKADQAPLRVHLAPVGFEVQRVTEPLIRLRADRVYLFTGDRDDQAAPHWKAVHDTINRDFRSLEVVDRFSPPWSYADLLRDFGAIAAAESAKGNHVFINVSTGTKVHAAVGMITCMLYGAKPYYAQVPYLDRQVAGKITPDPITDIKWPPVLRIPTPDPLDLAVMRAVNEAGEECRKEVLLQKLRAVGAFPGREKEELNTTYNRLNRVISRLVAARYVTTHNERGKSVVKLTGAGQDFGLLFGLTKKQS
jgi:hypothetical protein